MTLKTIGLKRACQILDLSEETVTRLTKTGAIPFHRDDGNRRKFYLKDVRRVARQRSSKQSVR